MNVPEAVGAKTVTGQLTVAEITGTGFITAYGCDDGPPVDSRGAFTKSDLNYHNEVSRTASNRLVVTADDDGDVCFYVSSRVELIVDISGVTDAIDHFANRRLDTRTGQGGGTVAAGGTLRVNVPEAVGAKTVTGQLTAARVVTDRGFVTAYACDDGPPIDGDGEFIKSDLNYVRNDAPANRVASNRLIVTADDDGDVCFYASSRVELIVDVSGVTDAIDHFANRRLDTRTGQGGGIVAAGGTLRVNVPEAVGAKTVTGQLTTAGVRERGFVTAYGCDDGAPVDGDGAFTKSDLNIYFGRDSNRLVVTADDDGDICFYASQEAHLIVDISGVTDAVTSFANRRTDTRPAIKREVQHIDTWTFNTRMASNGVAMWWTGRLPGIRGGPPGGDPQPPILGQISLDPFAISREVLEQEVNAVASDDGFIWVSGDSSAAPGFRQVPADSLGTTGFVPGDTVAAYEAANQLVIIDKSGVEIERQVCRCASMKVLATDGDKVIVREVGAFDTPNRADGRVVLYDVDPLTEIADFVVPDDDGYNAAVAHDGRIAFTNGANSVREAMAVEVRSATNLAVVSSTATLPEINGASVTHIERVPGAYWLLGRERIGDPVRGLVVRVGDDGDVTSYLLDRFGTDLEFAGGRLFIVEEASTMSFIANP